MDNCTGVGDWVSTFVAGGRVLGTWTVDASGDTRDRSQNPGLADFSEALPGTLTKDLTRSPTWWGATILVDDFGRDARLNYKCILVEYRSHS